MTSAERTFWEGFKRTHPWPPSALERQQRQTAEDILRRGARHAEHEKAVAMECGFPAEGCGDDVLLAAYCQAARQEYLALVHSGRTQESVSVRTFLAQLAVDASCVTNAPSESQLAAVSSWRIAYLQRLRREKVDESYIIAYLKAWSLSESEVFHADQHQ